MIFRALFPLLLLLPAIASAQGRPPEAGDSILVTGTPMEESQRALRDCIARKCAPAEDIDGRSRMPKACSSQATTRKRGASPRR